MTHHRLNISQSVYLSEVFTDRTSSNRVCTMLHSMYMRFLKKWFQGRAGRDMFLLSALFLLVIPLLQFLSFSYLYSIVLFPHFPEEPQQFFIASLLILLILPLFLLPVTVQRLRDMNRSRRFAIFIGIPFVNIFTASLFSIIPGSKKKSISRDKSHSLKRSVVVLCSILYIILLVVVLGLFIYICSLVR